ncbi:DUF6529 family protein, partial [Streptomyces canus]|uniref:DUF6529 family protein n=1 Tax=Streptomyces canus TaxID=58343 RepID=UPI003436D691
MTVDPNAATQSWPSPEPERRSGPARYLIPALVAAAVAVALGAYGKVHDPTGTAFNLAGFSSTGAVKSWLATVAFFFAIVQLVSALMLYGKLPGPSWGLPHDRVTSELACPVGRVGRMSLCPSLIRRS